MRPFVFLPGDRLSFAELAAARLDGDLVELGEGYLAADAVETAEARAASLAAVAGPHRALVAGSAAWVHGALARPPDVHALQRASATRTTSPLGRRITYRDQRLPDADVVLLGGVRVTTPVRTFVDCVRAAIAAPEASPLVEALLAWDPSLASRGLAWLDAAGPVHHKRAATRFLRARQEEVTR